MKKKIKQIVLVISFLLIAVLAVNVLYGIIRWKDTSGDYDSSIDQLKNTPKNTVDVVFVGSSHVYCGITPAVLWDNYGYSAFDMAVSGQSKELAYHGMVELLKTQSPKVVFVDLFAMTYSGAGEVEGNIHRNLLCLPTSANSVGMLLDYYGLEDSKKRQKVEDYFFRWPIIHTRYRELQRWDYVDCPTNEYLRGEGLTVKTNPVDLSRIGESEVAPAELSEENLAWLNSLKELSEKENFRLCFLVAPTFLTDDWQAIVDGAKFYADENGIAYLDLCRNKELLQLDGERDFADDSHLNIYGSEKLTGYLGSWLAENESLPDHRGEAGYECWNRDSEYSHKVKVLYEMENAQTLQEYITYLSGENGYTTIICKEFVYDESQQEYARAMTILGVEKEEFAQSGVWVYKDKKASRVAGLDLGKRQIYPINQTDNMIFEFKGDYQAENLLIGTEDYSNYGYYMSITVYDNELKKVVSHRGF